MRRALLCLTGCLALAQAPAESLLVSGRVKGGAVRLGPAFVAPMPGGSQAPEGPFVLEGLDGKGRSLLRIPFQVVEMADLPDAEAGFTVRAGLPAEKARAIRVLRVLKQGQELDRRTSTGPLPALKAQARRDGGRAILTWNRPFRFVLVRRPGTGEILATAEGQTLALSTDATRLELIASDGVRSRVTTVAIH